MEKKQNETEYRKCMGSVIQVEESAMVNILTSSHCRFPSTEMWSNCCTSSQTNISPSIRDSRLSWRRMQWESLWIQPETRAPGSIFFPSTRWSLILTVRSLRLVLQSEVIKYLLVKTDSFLPHYHSCYPGTSKYFHPARLEMHLFQIFIPVLL